MVVAKWATLAANLAGYDFAKVQPVVGVENSIYSIMFVLRQLLQRGGRRDLLWLSALSVDSSGAIGFEERERARAVGGWPARVCAELH